MVTATEVELAELIHDRGLDLVNRRIYLHGDESVKGEEPGVDYRMAATFNKNLDILNNSDAPIIVIMGTVGGCWNYGMSIYDAIKVSSAEVTIIAYSWARSMSSIILQAAKERVLMPHTDFMIHYGTTSFDGHYMTAKSGMKHEERSERVMLDIYAERCQYGPRFQGQSMYEIRTFLDRQMKDKGDWWLSAEEAVEYGFADRVETP